MGASTALVMTAFGAKLMPPAPPGPVEELLRLGRFLPDQVINQASDFWHRQRQELGDQGAPFSASAPRRDRTTATDASASIASVMWRYQPTQWRTSY